MGEKENEVRIIKSQKLRGGRAPEDGDSEPLRSGGGVWPAGISISSAQRRKPIKLEFRL